MLTNGRCNNVGNIISIARHSFQYWHDNGEKWYLEFKDHQQLKGWRDFSWNQTGKVDIAAGVGGAIAGAALGACATGGVGVGAGAIGGGLGGEIGGSITDAILQIWSSQTLDDTGELELEFK